MIFTSCYYTGYTTEKPNIAPKGNLSRAYWKLVTYLFLSLFFLPLSLQFASKSDDNDESLQDSIIINDSGSDSENDNENIKEPETIDELKIENKQLREELKELKIENEQLREELKEKESELEKVNKELQTIKIEKDNQETQIDELRNSDNDKANKLKIQEDKLFQQESFKNENKILKMKNNTQAYEINQLKNENKIIKDELTKKEMAYKDLEIKLNACQNVFGDNTSLSNNNISPLNKNTNEEKYLTLKSTFNTLKQVLGYKIINKSSRSTRQEVVLQELEEAITSCIDTINKLKEDKSKGSSDLENLNSELKKQKIKDTELENNLEEIQQEYIKLQDDYNKMKNNYIQINYNYNDKINEYNNIKEKYDQILIEKEKIEEENRELNNQLYLNQDSESDDQVTIVTSNRRRSFINVNNDSLDAQIGGAGDQGPMVQLTKQPSAVNNNELANQVRVYRQQTQMNVVSTVNLLQAEQANDPPKEKRDDDILFDLSSGSEKQYRKALVSNLIEAAMIKENQKEQEKELERLLQVYRKAYSSSKKDKNMDAEKEGQTKATDEYDYYTEKAGNQELEYSMLFSLNQYLENWEKSNKEQKVLEKPIKKIAAKYAYRETFIDAYHLEWIQLEMKDGKIGGKSEDSEKFDIDNVVNSIKSEVTRIIQEENDKNNRTKEADQKRKQEELQVKQTNKNLLAEKKRLKKEVNRLQKKLAKEKQTQKEEYERKLEEQQNEIKNLKKKYKNNLNQLKQKQQKEQESIHQKTKEIEKEKKKLEALLSKKKENKKEKKQKEQAKKLTKEEENEHQKAILEYQKQLKDLENQLKESQIQVKQIDKEHAIEDAKNEIRNELKNKWAKEEECLQDKIKEIENQYSKETKELEEKYQNLATNLDDLNKQLNEKNQTIRNKEQEIRKAKIEQKVISQASQKKEEKIASYQATIKSNQQTIQQLTSQHDQEIALLKADHEKKISDRIKILEGAHNKKINDRIKALKVAHEKDTKEQIKLLQSQWNASLSEKKGTDHDMPTINYYHLILELSEMEQINELHCFVPGYLQLGKVIKLVNIKEDDTILNIHVKDSSKVDYFHTISQEHLKEKEEETIRQLTVTLPSQKRLPSKKTTAAPVILPPDNEFFAEKKENSERDLPKIKIVEKEIVVNNDKENKSSFCDSAASKVIWGVGLGTFGIEVLDLLIPSLRNRLVKIFKKSSSVNVKKPPTTRKKKRKKPLVR